MWFAVLGLGLILAAGPLGWLAAGLALAIFAAVAVIALTSFRSSCAGLSRASTGSSAKPPVDGRDEPGHDARGDFGAANIVTAARAAVAALLVGAAFAVEPRWTLVAGAVVAFAADGLDGWLARRHERASAFGARFDMETDALFVLALSLCAFSWGKAGAFVLLSGALRYLFVAAGVLVPPLAAPLPPLWRRKAICVAQVALLIVAMTPATPRPVANALAAFGLALLTYSFAADCVRLLSGSYPFPIMRRQHARRSS